MLNIIRILLLIILGIILALITIIILKNKTIKIILNIITITIFVLTIIISIQKVIYKDNRVLNLYLYQMSSNSMANTLKTNDYILIKKSNKFKEGDIVTFKKENRLITHRIVKINGNKIITKGDSNLNVDKFITKDKIIGKIVFHGKILNALVSFLKYIIISYVTAFLFSQLIIPKTRII